MYYTYILKSQRNNRHYIGSTSNLDERLKRHNSGRNKSTKAGMPWKLLYYEKFLTEQEAYQREMKIKSYKGGKALKKLIDNS